MKIAIIAGKRGFTLIELLAVIFIVVILACLVFPLTNLIEASAQSARCVNNLRQIGVGVQSYAGDNNGKVMPRLLNWYHDVHPPGDQIAWYQRLYYFGYITDPNVFYCPTFFPKNSHEAIRINTAGGDTYGMRIWAVPGAPWVPNSEEEKPLSSIKTPSDFFLIVDSLWLSSKHQGYGVSPGLSDQNIHLRHRKKANALFADGHVEAKDGSYFEHLGSGKQAEYGVNNEEFSVTDNLNP